MPSVLSPESPQAEAILHLFRFVLLITGLIFTVVASLVAISVLRFRHRPGDALPKQDPGDTRLEILWTVVPGLIVIVLFAVTVRAMHTIDPPVHDRQPDLEVIAHQWWWEGRYPRTGAVVANEFNLPVGQTLLLEITSADVIHDFWVPALARKVDAIPNHPNHLWMKIDKPGTYLGTCDEFCGAEHAWMRIRVTGDEPADHRAWIEEQLAPARPPTSPAAIEGRRLFLAHTCASCHTISGVVTGEVGPDLTHVASRQTLAAGVLSNNAENLTAWIHDPQKFKPGCNMPNVQLSWPESRKIAAYLKELE